MPSTSWFATMPTTCLHLFCSSSWHAAKYQNGIPIQIEITLKRNFAFDQLIDKNVHVQDNSRSARVIVHFPTRGARCPGWVSKLRAGIVEGTYALDGPDGLFPKFLKPLSSHIAAVLSRMFNLSFLTAQVPEDWRGAIVTPVTETHHTTDPSASSLLFAKSLRRWGPLVSRIHLLRAANPVWLPCLAEFAQFLKLLYFIYNSTYYFSDIILNPRWNTNPMPGFWHKIWS